jgi:acyl-CoA synthetase (AMP-forming)/AMP-acid ligase II
MVLCFLFKPSSAERIAGIQVIDPLTAAAVIFSAGTSPVPEGVMFSSTLIPRAGGGPGAEACRLHRAINILKVQFSRIATDQTDQIESSTQSDIVKFKVDEEVDSLVMDVLLRRPWKDNAPD